MIVEAATPIADLPLGDRPGDLFGVRACAAKLTPSVSASTISRQLADGLFRNYGTVTAPLLSLAEVAKARAEKLNPAQQRTTARPTRSAKQSDGYHAARADRELAASKIAQLDLAERLGQLLPRDQVEDAFADMGRRTREALTQMVRAVVPELEDITGTEARIAHVTQKLEATLQSLAAEFDASGDGSGPASPK